jgi:hypothetical protein
LLIGSLAVATVVVLSLALARGLDHEYCDSGFSTLINCTFHWSSTTTHQSTPIFTTSSGSTAITQSGSPNTFQPDSVDVTSWAVVHCPQNFIAKRLLCAAASVAVPAQAASEHLVTGLPLPKPWVLMTAKNSPFITSVHVETPLGLAAALGLYRVELRKRGWTENDGAVVEPDRAVIAFTTTDGPALLRLIHQDDRTIAGLSLRKPGAVDKAGILPSPGQARLMLGNDTDEEAVIAINGQTITLAARARLRDSPEIDLPPGKLNVTLTVASSGARNRELEVAADETWGLLVGPTGVPLPLQLY